MKENILMSIMLGVVSSAVVTGCDGDPDQPDQPDDVGEKLLCQYDIQGGNAVSIPFGASYTNPSATVTTEGKEVIFKFDGSVDSSQLGKYEVTYTSEKCENSQVRVVTVVPSSCAYKLIGDNPLKINLGDTFAEPGFEVKDINNQVINGIATGTVDSNTLGQYKITYGSESCKNTQERTVVVSSPKVITSSCSYQLKGDNPVEIKLGGSFVEPGFEIKDSNNKIVKGIAAGTVNGNKLGQYKVTYTGENCDNSQARTVNVVPADVVSSACTYKLTGDNPFKINLGDAFVEPGFEVRDSSNKIVKGIATGTVDSNKLGQYKITYKGESCDNSNVRTVNVVPADVVSSACTYKLTGDNPFKINLGDAFVEPGFEVRDSNNKIVKGIATGTVDSKKLGQYKITYKGENCDNSNVRTVNVVPADVVSLSCTYKLTGDNPFKINLGDAFIEPGFEVRDSNNKIVKGIATGTVDSKKVGQYKITYKGEKCDNSQIRIVNVVSSSCTYKLTGDNPFEISLGNAFVEPGFEVKNSNDKIVKGSATGIVDSNKLGQYDVTYTGENCDNSHVRTVNVVPSLCTYELAGNNPLDINAGDVFVEPGFEVKDSNNKVIKGVVAGSVDSNKLGQYEMTYSSENCKNSQVRTVNVVASLCNYDVIGDNPVEMSLDGTYQEQGVSIKNVNDKPVTGTISGAVDVKTVGDYTLTYQSDACTNTATRVVKIVLADCVYTLTGNDPLLISKNDVFVDPGVAVKNSLDSEVTSVTSGEVDTSTLGDYVLTYQGKDCANSQTRTVKVELQTCAYTLLGDSPLEVLLNTPYTDFGAEIKDNKEVILETKAMGIGTVDNTKVGEYVITYQLEACGNSMDRIVKVRALTDDELQDTILPTI